MFWGGLKKLISRRITWKSDFDSSSLESLEFHSFLFSNKVETKFFEMYKQLFW